MRSIIVITLMAELNSVFGHSKIIYNHYYFKAKRGRGFVVPCRNCTTEKKIKFVPECKERFRQEVKKMKSAAIVQRRRQRSLIIKESKKCRKLRKHSKGRSVTSKTKRQGNMTSKAKGQQKRRKRKRRRKCDALARRKGRLSFMNFGPGSTCSIWDPSWGWIGYEVGQGGRFTFFLVV